MTTASKITLVRVVMIPIFMALLLLGYRWAALAVSRQVSSTRTSSHARLRNATSPPPVGAGEPHCAGSLQICADLRRGKAGGGQAV